jgi:hypothetical protein
MSDISHWPDGTPVANPLPPAELWPDGSPVVGAPLNPVDEARATLARLDARDIIERSRARKQRRLARQKKAEALTIEQPAPTRVVDTGPDIGPIIAEAEAALRAANREIVARRGRR